MEGQPISKRAAKRQRRQARKALENLEAREVIAGSGGYYTEKVLPVLRKLVPKGTFARGGEMVGGVLTKRAGDLIAPEVGDWARGSGRNAGRNVGQAISRILGFGAYRVKSNSLVKTGGVLPEGEAVPAFADLGRTTRVRHREYVMDLAVPTTPADFTLLSFDINPGNPGLFPWLASLARNYQQYKMRGMVVVFKTASSDITAGGALGTVVIATNYDADETDFPDKASMENSEYACSAKPSVSQLHTIECAPSEQANTLYYVKGPSNTTTSDARLYNLGKLQIATQGLPGSATAGDVLGELWVSYDVELLKPVKGNDPFQTIVGGGTVSLASIFGTAPALTGSPLVSVNASTMTFANPGQYFVQLTVSGSSVNTNPVTSGTVGINLVEDAWGGSGPNGAIAWGITVTQPGQTFYIDCSSAAASITFSKSFVTLADPAALG